MDGPSVLEGLECCRVVSFERQGDMIAVREECDRCFFVQLTLDQARQLAREIERLAEAQ